VPQRESVYVTSTLNTFLRYNGDRYIGGYSTTHSRLTPLPNEPLRISLMYLIFLETRIIHLHFPADSLCLASFKFFWWAPQDFFFIFIYFLQKGRFSRSRSSKVDKFGANRKRGVDFILVRNSNFGPILHRFRARTRFMCYLPRPYSTLILGVFPLHQIAHVGVSQSRGLKLFGHEIIFEEFQPM